ncbi:MAG: peptidoglycan DD-metalloendopeptidase family protein [Lachnospiraceae bacterium]|nr:peptidoglycan DD-metalloendopeptidase family protein [Lachnospiraceae bacterium]
MHFKKRRLLSAVLLVVFLLQIANTGIKAYADTAELEASIKAKQAEIQEAEKEKQQLKSSITDAKKIVSGLESTKKDLEAYVTELDANLTDVEAKIAELKELIADKEAEIEEATADLEEAEEIQQTQYENMKKRIKFMYEKGDTFFLDLIFSASSYADMLNKADYAEKLSEYDAKKLEEYKQTCEYVAACKADLEADKEVLDEAKAKQDEEQENLNTLIAAKNSEISMTAADIHNKEAAIKELEADMAARDAAIKQLEQIVAEERRRLAEESGKVLTYDGGMFKWPAPSYTRISDDYGNRIHPITGTNQFHNGVDMAAPGGSPILAAYDGEVVAATYNASMGNYVMIDHGDSLYTIYMHASALYVSKGDYVSKGQKIAAVGTTGRSTGNHLHFSVRKNGSYVSPWNYLSK